MLRRRNSRTPPRQRYDLGEWLRIRSVGSVRFASRAVFARSPAVARREICCRRSFPESAESGRIPFRRNARAKALAWRRRHYPVPAGGGAFFLCVAGALAEEVAPPPLW